MSIPRSVAAVLISVALLSPVFGQGAPPDTPVVGMKEKVHGTIAGGDTLPVRFFAAAGTTLKVKLKKEGKVDPALTGELLDPDGAPVALGSKVVLAKTGEHLLSVSSESGGEFRLDIKGKASGSTKVTGVLADGVQADVFFGAFAGTTLRLKIKKVAAIRLLAPDGTEVAIRKKTLLVSDGEYVLTIRGTGEPYALTLKRKAPKPEKRERYIARDDLGAVRFGPAPVIEETDPVEGLDDGPLSGISVIGTNFESGAKVSLVSGKTLVAGTATYVSPTELAAGFDLTGLKAGNWKLRVRNASGGEAESKFKVIKASGVRLPDGVWDDTELWFLDFDDEFLLDLAEFGLRGTSDDVNASAAAGVRSYVLFLLRTHFGRDGVKGRARDGNAIPVSFILGEVRESVGKPGVDYNRIAIGGVSLFDDSDPDNDKIPWGFVGVDAGNLGVEDIGGVTAGTRAVPTAEMADRDYTTKPFEDTFAPLLADPLDAGDLRFFTAGFFPRTAEDVGRMEAVVVAVETLGRELAGVIAHHVARAMGVGNGSKGIMDTPTRFGVFGSDRELSFESAEMAVMRTSARATELPGKSNPLRAGLFPLLPTQPEVLPEAEAGESFTVDFGVVGGRPDRTEENTRVTLVEVFNELGIELKGMAFFEGVLAGTPSELSIGTFWLRIGLEEKINGAWTGYSLWHRLDIVNRR